MGNSIPTLTPATGRVDFAMRNVQFDVSGSNVGNWHPAGRHVSQFFNALSVRFPEGEKFFINSVRHYRDQIKDPALLGDIEAFIGQEAMHGREHRTYNAALERAGYPANQMEQELKSQIKRLKMPPLFQLSVTCAAEHFTAIMSGALISDDRMFDGAEPEMAAMWRWHALEETEHKAVAYDVFMTVRKGAISGYFLRCFMMLLTTVSFSFNVFSNLIRLLYRDHLLTDVRGWLKLGRFLLGSPGLARVIFLPYLGYFKPGFHPWHGRAPRDLERYRLAANTRLATQQQIRTPSKSAA